ncbi:MAG: glycosyltransferase family 39 protein [Pseudomonadota bacterium]
MRDSLVPQIILLLIVWAVIIVFIDPVGEFMTNDDWSFVRVYEALRDEGKIIATGWGRGGPSAIVHVLWGGAFTHVFGYSLTMLRISVLCLAVLTSCSLLMIFRQSGASPWTALVGALTFMANPFVMSQAFTFMTDITFVCLMVFCVFWLARGVERENIPEITLGLFLALLAILTRQIGIVIPAAFVATILIHPRGRDLPRIKLIALCIAVTILPWILYEWSLHMLGSTPVTKHEVFHNLWARPMEYGFPRYIWVVLAQILEAAGGWVCLFVAPLAMLNLRVLLRTKAFQLLAAALALGTVAAVTLIHKGVIDLPVVFHGNVLYDFGIGPIVLKDTYILKIPPNDRVPKEVFYLTVGFLLLSGGAVVRLLISHFVRLFSGPDRISDKPASFLGTFAVLASFCYLGIIGLTGFLDRYLIPLIALCMIWLTADYADIMNRSVKGWWSIACLIFILCLGSQSAEAVQDFMAMKRELASAQRFVVEELHTSPCNMDGGFEFNGYHCYRPDYARRDSISWWWVEREDYLLTLTPLPGYKVIKTFPFRRYIGRNGAVHVLQPENPPPAF